MTSVSIPVDAIHQDTLGTPKATPRHLALEPPSNGPSPPPLPTPSYLEGASPRTPQSPTPPQQRNTALMDFWGSTRRYIGNPTTPQGNSPQPTVNPPNLGANTAPTTNPDPPTNRPNPRKPTLQMLAAAGGIRPKQHANSGPAHDPHAKFLKAEMPIIHDANPSGLLELVEWELLDEWEKLPEGKLAIVPFGIEIHSNEQLYELRDQLFTTIVEITQAEKLGIAVPKPNEKALAIKRFPTTFLVYNLTEQQSDTLQKRTVWSSPEITFRVATTDPCRPDFLFAIGNYTNLDTNEVRKLVHQIWTDNTSQEFFNSLIQAMDTDETPQDDLPLTSADIIAFVGSLNVKVLKLLEKKNKSRENRIDYPPQQDKKKPPKILKPRFYIYADSSHIRDFKVWSQIRLFLAERSYYNLMLGQGKTMIAPHNCGVCHGADHPRGMCPFPLIPGWQGPKHKPEDDASGPGSGPHFPRVKRQRI